MGVRDSRVRVRVGSRVGFRVGFIAKVRVRVRVGARVRVRIVGVRVRCFRCLLNSALKDLAITKLIHIFATLIIIDVPICQSGFSLEKVINF